MDLGLQIGCDKFIGMKGPKNFSNLSTWLSSSVAPQTTYMDGAIQFKAADKGYLTIADNATISATTVIEVGAWVYLDSVGVQRPIIVKGTDVGVAASLEYGLYYSHVGTNFKFSVSNGSTITTVTDTGTAPSTNTWYFLRAGLKSDGTLFIQRNGTAEITSASCPAIQDGANALFIGMSSGGTTFMDGRLDSSYITKTTSATGEVTSLYNSGNGRMLSDLTVANGLASFRANCISWYGFNEDSGIRYDAIGSNHLTPAFVNIIDATTLNGGFETAGAGGADVFASWGEVITGTSALTRDTTTYAVGTASCRMDIDASNSIAAITQLVIRAGAKYRVTAKVRHNKGSSITQVQVAIGEASDVAVTVPAILTDTWTDFTYYFTGGSAGPTFGFARPSGAGLASKSYWLDAITLVCTEIQCVAGIAAGVATDGNLCASFNGTSQYLSVASNASLQTGDIDFTVWGWVNFNSLASVQYFISKYGTGTREYTLAYNAGVLKFQVSADGSAVSSQPGTFAPVVNSWYFVVGYHDSVNNKVGIIVNDGTPETSNYSSGVFSSTADFCIGGAAGGATLANARIDQVGFIKRMLTAAEITALYNLGKGVKYANWPTTITSDASLKAAYNLDMYSAGTGLVTRSDMTSNGNDLTDHANTPSGQGVNYFEGTISKWFDSSGNGDDGIQTTQANRLLYRTNQQGGKPALTGDGLTKSILNATDLVGTGDVTVWIVLKPRGLGGGSAQRVFSNSTFEIRVTTAVDVTSNAFSSTAAGGASSISLGTAYVVAITRTSAGVANIYLNGALSGTANQSSGTPSAGTPTYIGNRADGTRGFNGDIYEVAIYGKMQSSQELASLTAYFRAQYSI